MQYPADNLGEAVVYTYNPRSLLQTVVGLSIYLGEITYTELEQVRKRILGGATPVVQQLHTYDANRAWLIGLTAGNNAPDYNNRQNLSYTYDAAGNLLSISD